MNRKPGNVQGAGICLLIGGIFAMLVSIGVLIGTCFVWVFGLYGFVAGIMAVVRGARLLGECEGTGNSMAAPIMLIINIINFDTIGLILGIVALVLLSDDSSRRYLEGFGPDPGFDSSGS